MATINILEGIELRTCWRSSICCRTSCSIAVGSAAASLPSTLIMLLILILGFGGSKRPCRINSCFSFSRSRRLCVRNFFLSCRRRKRVPVDSRLLPTQLTHELYVRFTLIILLQLSLTGCHCLAGCLCRGPHHTLSTNGAHEWIRNLPNSGAHSTAVQASQ